MSLYIYIYMSLTVRVVLLVTMRPSLRPPPVPLSTHGVAISTRGKSRRAATQNRPIQKPPQCAPVVMRGREGGPSKEPSAEGPRHDDVTKHISRRRRHFPSESSRGWYEFNDNNNKKRRGRGAPPGCVLKSVKTAFKRPSR